jgi:hypothetical protein
MTTTTKSGGTLVTIPKLRDFEPWVKNELIIRYALTRYDEEMQSIDIELITTTGLMPGDETHRESTLRIRLDISLHKGSFRNDRFEVEHHMGRDSRVMLTERFSEWHERGNETHRFRAEHNPACWYWLRPLPFVGIVATREGKEGQRSSRLRECGLHEHLLFVPFTAFAIAKLQMYRSAMNAALTTSGHEQEKYRLLKQLVARFEAFASQRILFVMSDLPSE